MDSKIEKLRELIGTSDKIVFFGGAGISTESGIPDFRSVDGLYSQKYKYPPETILSGSFLKENPEAFFDFFREKLVYPHARPNAAHIKLAQLEAAGKLIAVITQNVDGLHQMAGSKNVLELHGNRNRCYCVSCKKSFESAFIVESSGVPRCGCGGIVRPDVVLYEESLDDKVISSAVGALRKAEVLIIGGTSLAVYPAAGLISYYRGNKLVLINRGHTPYDDDADLHITDNIGEVFSKV